MTILNDSDTKKWPLLIPGEEVTSRHVISSSSVDPIPVHVNGYGIKKLVKPSEANNIIEALRENIDGIVKAGGLASINHPNYKWALSYEHLNAVENYKFIEVFNGHAGSNSFGDNKKPSVSTMWDQLLSNGKKILGLATDDAHHYHEFSPEKANPGRGWIQVFSENLNKSSILESMSSGDFYASTGVELGDFTISKKEIILEINDLENGSKKNQYTFNFITNKGVISDQITGLSGRYYPSKNDVYVRVEIICSNGTRLWTQPIWITD